MKIIKSFVLSGAFALVSLGASAQAVFGVKAGANLGVVYGTAEEQGGNTIESVSPDLGFQGGLFVAKDLSESIGLMVELNYELKRGNKEISEFTLNQTTYASALQPTVEAGLLAQGATPEQATAGAMAALAGMGELAFTTKLRGDQANTFSYVNLPILVTFGSGKGKFYAGPNVGFVLTGKAEVNSTGRNEHTLTDENLAPAVAASLSADQVKASIDANTDISLRTLSNIAAIGDLEVELDLLDDENDRLNQFVLGFNIGYMYNLNDNLFLDIRINHDLTDLTKDENDSALAEPAFGVAREDRDHQLGAQLSVGYKF